MQIPTVGAFKKSLAEMEDEARRRVLSRGDAVVAHVFDLHGSEATTIGPEIDWSKSFKVGRRLTDEAHPWVTHCCYSAWADANRPTSRVGTTVMRRWRGHPVHMRPRAGHASGLLEIPEEVISDSRHLLEGTFSLADCRASAQGQSPWPCSTRVGLRSRAGTWSCRRGRLISAELRVRIDVSRLCLRVEQVTSRGH